MVKENRARLDIFLQLSFLQISSRGGFLKIIISVGIPTSAVPA